MQKQNNIPLLRFPEFTDEWSRKKLGEIFSISAGGDIETEHVSQTKDDVFKYPIYANAEKGKGFYGWADIYKVEANVVTVAGRGVNIGIAHARDHKFYPIIRLLVLKPQNKESIYFFEYQINRLNLFKESTGVPQLTAPQVSGYEVAYPTLQDQNRVASFINAIVKRISQLTEKKTLLKKYRKGVTQKIFSQELRFKNDKGEYFPKWVNKKLGEIAIKKSSNISANKIEDNFGEYIIYGASGILKKVDFYEEENDYISIVKDGAGVGRLFYCKGKTSVLGTMDIIKPQAEINTHYLHSLLSNIDFVKYVSGSTIPHIYFKDYSNEICGIPSLEEQNKIATFLFSLDEKINHTQNQITKSEQFKDGLLQKMFC